MGPRCDLREINGVYAGIALAMDKASFTYPLVKCSEPVSPLASALAKDAPDAGTAAAQIAASSQQQLVGVSQVAEAMESISDGGGVEVIQAAARELAERLQLPSRSPVQR